MLLIYILICIFVLLLGQQIILAFSNDNSIKGYGYTNKGYIIEGMDNNTSTTNEYKPYNVNDPNNALILAQQNAGNIEVLKGRVDNLDGIKTRVDDMQQNINSMQTQLDGLVQQQADYAQQLAGNTPPDITGTEGQTTANVETSIEEEDKQ
jgi:hypothetical protein